MKIRTLTLLLAVIMCTSTLFACASSSKNSKESSETTSQIMAEIDPEIKAVNEYVASLASDNNLEGRSFAYVGGNQQAELQEEVGNIENDALYKRQRDIEEIFGIDWINATVQEDANSTTGHGVIDSVKRSVMAETKDYDLVAGTLLVVGQPLLNGQCLEDVSDFTVLDLSADWWPQTLSETHSLAGKLFFLNGPIITSYYVDAMSVLFNKDIMDDFGIDEPYDIVSSGDWTFDKMVELASAVPYNTDGNSVYRYGNPYGLGFLYGFDYRVTQFDEAGTPYVDTALPQMLSNIADKVSAIMGDDTQSAHVKYQTLGETVDTKYGKELHELFADDNILFYFGATGTAAGLRDQDVSYGILPMPKYDTNQKNYVSLADSWGAMFCYVPVCTRDIATTDVIVEAMAALGLKHIKPAYYDKLLKGRSTYDSDSKAMIDIIFDTKIYDIIDIYSLGDINTEGPFVRALNKAIEYDTSTLSSDYFIYSKKANNQIYSIMKMVEKK